MTSIGVIKSPSATIHPTLADIAWVAGFLEGEGCFISRRKVYGQEVIVTQVNREPLGKLQRLLGGSIKFYPYHGTVGAFRWLACGSRARGIMMTVFTFMSRKRKDQIKIALKEERYE